jgi:hypothetical protein
MFQTLLINLSYYSHLLSMSFVMNIADIYHRHVMILALRELNPLLLSSFVKLIRIRSIHALVTLIILQRLLLLWCVCFLPHLMGDLLLFP